MEQPIQKTSISQQVVDYILERINCGAWRPGDRLPGEREFAETLGISRVPLREAISALCAIGILVSGYLLHFFYGEEMPHFHVL